MKSAIFFDRDDTLIIDSHYMNDPTQIHYIEGVFEALNQLKSSFDFFVVTNQSGVPRGLVHEKNLHLIHQKMKTDFLEHNIDIKEFLYAPYMPESHHYYRKPNPGMLIEILEIYKYQPQTCWMIGDRESDVLCGKNAKTKTVLITSNKNVSTNADLVFQNVLDFSNYTNSLK